MRGYMNQRLSCLLLFCATALISLGYGLYVIALDYMDYPKYLPDDAFYYLQVARVLSEHGLYSFDNGFSLNTGFHLWWFYHVAALSALLAGEPAALLTAATASGWLISLATLVLAAVYCYRYFPAALAVIAVMLSGYSFLNGQIAAMEWPLCIAISTLIYLALIKPQQTPRASVFVILGLLGSLARSDFGGISVALLAAAYLTNLLVKDRSAITAAWSLFAGALLGFALVCLHNYLIAGDWLSTSARMKRHWGSVAPIDPFAPILQFVRAVIYIVPVSEAERAAVRQQLSGWLYVVPWLLLISAIAGWVLRRRLIMAVGSSTRRLVNNPRILCLSLAALFSIGGYLAVYSRNAMGMQSWYSAHVFVPIGFLLMLLMHALAAVNARAFALAIGICLAIIITNFSVFFTAPATYAHQVHLRDLGLAVADGVQNGKLPAVVGLSDAGLAGFYSGGHVVNLDGLVNRDIAKYFPDRLPCYFYDSQLELAGRFGTTERLGNKIAWQQFSEDFGYRSDAGPSIRLRRLDHEKIDAIYGCSKSPRRKEGT